MFLCFWTTIDQQVKIKSKTLSYVDNFLIARDLVFCKVILKKGEYMVKDSQVWLLWKNENPTQNLTFFHDYFGTRWGTLADEKEKTTIRISIEVETIYNTLRA